MPLPELLLAYCQLDTKEQLSLNQNTTIFIQENDFVHAFGNWHPFCISPGVLPFHFIGIPPQNSYVPPLQVKYSTIVHFTDCPDRQNMAWSKVWRTGLLFQCTVYLVICNRTEQCRSVKVFWCRIGGSHCSGKTKMGGILMLVADFCEFYRITPFILPH